ncbi:MAG: DNA recombination protein RmuC [Phycisphaerales bacterium]
MDSLHIILLILAIAAFAFAAWVFMQLTKAHSRSAVLQTSLDHAEKTALDLQSKERQALARIDALLHESNQRENDIIKLKADLETLSLSRDAEIRRVQELAAADREASLRRENATKEHAQQSLAAMKLQAEQQLAAMKEQFKSLAADALKDTSQQFTAYATQALTTQNQKAASELEQRKTAIDNILKPISETLEKTQSRLAELDKNRATTQATLEEQVKMMREASTRLSDETKRLGEALRKPDVRGRYGEMQLRRVAELAGMVEYCDFATQATIEANDGSRQRPDMVVKLPSGRCVVVDAKTNIQSYLDAINAPSADVAEQHLTKFSQHVAQQSTDLGKKEYWKNFEGSPDFVVMFVPGDQFLDAALARQPDLMEAAWSRRVMLASPATLIGLLRAVAVGYREETLAKAAEELRSLGREFHDRFATAVTHIAGVGKNLEQATKVYNDFVGSYETRLLPTLRKFEASDVRGKNNIPELKSVDALPRSLATDQTLQAKLTRQLPARTEEPKLEQPPVLFGDGS